MAVKLRNRIATPLRVVLNPSVDFKNVESVSETYGQHQNLTSTERPTLEIQGGTPSVLC
jgi:hypothetical protein